MYCPQCATQAVDDARYCRVCGTDLQAVTSAIHGQLGPHDFLNRSDQEAAAAAQWLAKKGKSARQVVLGAILLSAALALAVVPGFFFAGGHGQWLLLWTFFFGWMACWGVVSLGLGLGGMLEARTMLNYRDEGTQRLAGSTRAGLSAGHQSGISPGASGVREALPPPSVTEQTTRHLDGPPSPKD